MKNLLLALLLLVGSAQACEKITVETIPFDPPFNSDLTIKEISKMAGSPTIGVTSAIWVSRLAGCTLHVGYDQAKVLIAKELHTDQCVLGVVMEHEQQHVDAYRKSLELLPSLILARSPTIETAERIGKEEMMRFIPAQRQIDGFDEVQRVMVSCNGRTLLMQRQHHHGH